MTGGSDDRGGWPGPPSSARFDTPGPTEAYAAAPELLAEAAALLAYSTRLTTGEAGPDREREYRLRRAALADRYALRAAGEKPGSKAAKEAGEEAERTACDLLAWDREHSTEFAGPHTSVITERNPSHRPYVRREYAVWITFRG